MNSRDKRHLIRKNRAIREGQNATIVFGGINPLEFVDPDAGLILVKEDSILEYRKANPSK